MPVSGVSWKPWRVALAVVVLAALATQVEAQRRRSFGGARIATADDFDGRFHFCRVVFDGGSWSVDWPRADINLSIRLSELTKTTVGFDGPEDPKHVVIRLTDPTLYRCPFIMMTEVGAAYLDDAEAEALRNYLGCCFLQSLFYGMIQMIHMDIQLTCIFRSGTELDGRMVIIYRELTFQQFNKQSRDSL